MKDKEKQIEEMANIIKAVKYEPFNEGKPTYTVGNQMQDFVFDLIAEELIKQGYRKIDKNSVVLSREEWEAKLDEQYEKGQLDTRNDFDGKIVLERERFEHLCDLAYFGSGEEEIRKETAEKIICVIKTFSYDKEFTKIITRIISERFGVEIKE